MSSSSTKVSSDILFKRSNKTLRSPTRRSERLATKPTHNVTNTEVNQEISTTQAIVATQLTETGKGTWTPTEVNKLRKPIEIIEPIAEKQIVNKMNGKEINQHITNTIPEFNGEDESPHALTRFIKMADGVYEELNNDEKKLFDKYIMFRLTGNAFERIHVRDIKDYQSLKNILRNLYTKTYSLHELEQNFVTIRQKFGESIRNYGLRINEALDKYKEGYRTKYNIRDIGEAYNKHLEDNAVKTFKLGINNTVLKERIITSDAESIEAITQETEKIEKMLLLSTDTLTVPTPVQTNKTMEQLYSSNKSSKINTNQTIICNYCQKPNHTWNVCRSRINNENNRQQFLQTKSDFRINNRMSQPYNVRNPYNTQPRNTYQQNQYRNFNTNDQTKYNNQQNTQYTDPQRNQNKFNQTANHINYTPYNKYNNNFYSDKPAKYCSFCKTTAGHTFDECRNKLRAPGQYNQANQHNNNHSTGNNQLTEQFSKMRINTIQPVRTEVTNEMNDQGNEHGSSQQ